MEAGQPVLRGATAARPGNAEARGALPGVQRPAGRAARSGGAPRHSARSAHRLEPRVGAVLGTLLRPPLGRPSARRGGRAGTGIGRLTRSLARRLCACRRAGLCIARAAVSAVDRGNRRPRRACTRAAALLVAPPADRQLRPRARNSCTCNRATRVAPAATLASGICRDDAGALIHPRRHTRRPRRARLGGPSAANEASARDAGDGHRGVASCAADLRCADAPDHRVHAQPVSSPATRVVGLHSLALRRRREGARQGRPDLPPASSVRRRVRDRRHRRALCVPPRGAAAARGGRRRDRAVAARAELHRAAARASRSSRSQHSAWRSPSKR